MKRKIVRHGPSTYIISLPINWIKEHDIKKGSELEVTEEGNKIIVSMDEKLKPLEASIDITGLDRTAIMFAIRSLYRLGYDIVNVKFNSSTTPYYKTGKLVNVSSAIHKEVNRLIGYEIIQEKENFCTIKDLQVVSEKEFEQILKRIFFILVDASKDFILGAKNNNSQLLESIENKHDSITRFVSYCMRLLNKKGYPDQKKTAYYYHILGLLDRVADVLKYAARDLIEYGKKPSNITIEIMESTTKDISKFFELFYNYDNKKADEIHINRYKVEKALKNFPKSINSQEIVIATNVFNILWIILDLIEARTALEY